MIDKEADSRELLDGGLQRMALVVLAGIRDKAEAEFLTALKEDSRIADNMRDYWKHQNCGAER